MGSPGRAVCRILVVLVTAVVGFQTCFGRDLTLGLPPMISADRAVHGKAQIALGRKLFFDTRLSADGSISCAGCHQPEYAFSDGKQVAEGIAHQKGARNTPSLLNVAFNTALTWDGRHATLETQAIEPILNPREHGLRDGASLLGRIRGDPDYVGAFAEAFLLPPASITVAHVGRALASFERTLVSGGSPFDRFQYGHEPNALSPSAQRGLELFRGAARCASCHSIGTDYALFTDNSYHTVDVGILGVGARLAELTAHVVQSRQAGVKLDALLMSDPAIAELGRFVVTLDPRDIGKFKTPSLRNVASTAPYMHNGSVATLAEAVDRELYDHAGDLPSPLILTPREKSDLLTFLRALTGPNLSANNQK